jgi:hypothetical protein
MTTVVAAALPLAVCFDERYVQCVDNAEVNNLTR